MVLNPSELKRDPYDLATVWKFHTKQANQIRCFSLRSPQCSTLWMRLYFYMILISQGLLRITLLQIPKNIDFPNLMINQMSSPQAGKPCIKISNSPNGLIVR